jgi:WD40 repeat protein
VIDLAFSRDGEILAVADAGGGVALWNSATRQRIGPVLNVGPLGAAALAFDPAAPVLVTASGLGVIDFWSIPAGRLLASESDGDSGISRISYSPHGNLIVAATDNGTLQLWDPTAHHETGSFPAGTQTVRTSDYSDAAIDAMAFNPQGTELATAGSNGTTLVWDLATDQQIGAVLSPRAANGAAVAFSPGGQELATVGSSDATWWNVAFPGNLLGSTCQIAGSSLSRQEWKTYVPAEPYRNPCAA